MISTKNQILSNNKVLFPLLIIVSFILYGNTLTHDYALDDAIVITKNEFTTQGFSGLPDIFTKESFTGFFGRQKDLVSGGRYRPLSIATFAIEYEFFGKNTFVSHLINLFLYGCIAWFIFLTTSILLSERLGETLARNVALLASLLFLIHPIHTECVANIKGRDELLSLLFSLWSFLLLIRYSKTDKIIQLVLATSLLFIGMLAKENALTFIAVIPLGLWFFVDTTNKRLILITSSLFAVAVIFIGIRTAILGGIKFEAASELMNNPFIEASSNQKLATVLFTWLIYLKLLVFPHPLTFDYYPKHIPIVEFSNPAVLLSIVFIIVLGFIAIKGLKKKSIIAFCILAFGLTFSVVSNLLFSVGTFMNERFVFMPSVFWSVAIAHLILQIYKHKKLKYLAFISLVYMLVFYPIKTIARNQAWENDFTLFTTDVKTSSNSAKSNCSAGGQLWEAGKKLKEGTKQSNYYKKSEKYLRKAVHIHKTYTDAWLLLGNVLFDAKKDINGAATCYMNVIKLQLQNPNGWNNIDIVLQQSDDRNMQLNYYQQLHKIDSLKYKTNYRLGVLHGRYLNDLNKGIYYLEKAASIDPKQKEALKDLGTAYGISQRPDKAYEVLNKIISIDSTDVQVYINLGVACQQMGRTKEAETYFAKAQLLQKQK